MFLRTTAVTALCLASSATFAQCAPAPDSAYFFRDLSEHRANAKIAADRAFYEQLLTPAFESRTVEGRTVSRADFIAAELAPHGVDARRRYHAISNYTLLEHRQGHTVTTYLLRESATRDGVTRLVESQLRETYEVVDGRWRLVALTATAVPAHP